MTRGQQPKVKAYIQMASSLGAILGCLIAPILSEKFGRRPVDFGLCLDFVFVCSSLFRAFLFTVGMVGMCPASF